MNDWSKLTKQAAFYKEMYPQGTRIELQHMEDPWAPVPAGTRGTVEAVDDIGQIHMLWDNGRTLALVPGEDSFRKLTPLELAEEQKSFADKLAEAKARAKETGSEEKGSPERAEHSLD